MLQNPYHEPAPSTMPSPATGATAKPDLDSARLFLAALDPTAAAFEFRCFHEVRKRAKCFKLRGTLDAKAPELDRINRGRSPYGVFLTINETDGRGVKAPNITRVRAVFGDFDAAPIRDFPLQPSMIVTTSSPSNFHAYWLVADEMTFDTFKAIEMRLVQDFGADPKASDLARVLRLPGFTHRKNTPILVRLTECSGQRYATAELVAAFGATVATSPAATAAPAPRQRAASLPAIKLDQPANIERARAWLAKREPAVEGEGGNHHTFVTAARMRDFGLSQNAALDLMFVWNDSCCPTWSADDLEGIVKNAYQYGQNALGSDTPEAHFTALDQGGATRIEWPRRTASGAPDPNQLANVQAMIEHQGVAVWLNEFTGIEHVTGMPGELELGDRATRSLWARARDLGLPAQYDSFVRLLSVAAAAKRRHPVREYLDGLAWDGVPRLDRWLSTYCGADENPLNDHFGWRTLVAAVRRVRQPGCKWDQMLVLESPEGTGKSSVVSILGGEWAGDNLQLGLGAKETIEATQGKWLVEVPELSGMTSRDVEHVKAQISRQSDRARLAYERKPTEIPRQFVMFGSTNDEQYLRSRTGNRRFWPVKIGRVALDALRRDRDLLWAEAVQIEAMMREEGYPLALPDGLWSEASAVQEARVDMHPHEMRIREFLDADALEHFGDAMLTISAHDVFKIMGLDPAHRRQADNQTAGRAMMAMGWQRTRARTGGPRVYAYEKGAGERLWLTFDGVALCGPREGRCP